MAADENDGRSDAGGADGADTRQERGAAGRVAGVRNDAVELAAGVADLAVEGLRAAARGTAGLLRRSDLAGLAQDGRQDLRARGRLALDRHGGGTPPAHMELLARRAAERRAAPTAAPASADAAPAEPSTAGAAASGATGTAAAPGDTARPARAAGHDG